MAKIGDFSAVGVGSGNVLNPKDWLKVILGFIVLLGSLSIVQRIGGKLQNATGGWVDTTPNPLFEQPVAAAPRDSSIIFGG